MFADLLFFFFKKKIENVIIEKSVFHVYQLQSLYSLCIWGVSEMYHTIFEKNKIESLDILQVCRL